MHGFFMTASQILVVNQESLQLEKVVFYKTKCGSLDLKQDCITEP